MEHQLFDKITVLAVVEGGCTNWGGEEEGKKKSEEKHCTFQRNHCTVTLGGLLDKPLLWFGLGRPAITPKIGNWPVFVLLGWRFDFRNIHELRRARFPHPQMSSRLWWEKLFL